MASVYFPVTLYEAPRFVRRRPFFDCAPNFAVKRRRCHQPHPLESILRPFFNDEETFKDGKEAFEAVMHLRGFAAEDVKVKLDKKSNAVSVKAEKEIKDEEGNVRSFRRFERSFVLPKEADVNELKTAMAKDGTMKLTCAKKAKAVEGPTEPEDKNDANETMDRSSNNKEAEVEKDAAENKENDDVVEVAIDNSSDPVEKEAESNTDMDEVEVTMESMSVEPTPSSPFEFTVNVAGFEPENLSVEIGEDEIRVNAKREEETEDGSLETKQIAKKVKVSFDDFDIDGIFSELSKEGVLTVTIPPKMEKPVAREVPINIARE